MPNYEDDIALRRFYQEQLDELALMDPNDICPNCGKEVAQGQGLCEDCEIKNILDKGMDQLKLKHYDYYIAPGAALLEQAGYEEIADGDYDNPISDAVVEQAFKDYNKVISICRQCGMDYDDIDEHLWVKDPK